MPPIESIPKTANTHEVPTSQDSLTHAMDNAFPEDMADASPEDAASTLPAGFAGTDPDAALLEAVPTLPDTDFEKLQHEVARTRVIFVRGAAAISITAILSIGGALLFHFVAVGGFFLALFLTVTHPGGSGNGDLGSQSAGSNGGSVIVGNGPQGPPQIATDVNILLNRTTSPPLPSAPSLPDVMPTSTDPRELAATELQPPDPSVIGIPSGDNRIGTPRPAALPRHVAPQPTPPSTLVVTPPSHDAAPADDNTKVIVASAGARDQSPSSPNAGTGAGGDDDPFGNEPIIPGAKTGTGSGGNGSGDGGGLDRGASGANNPVPAILEFDMPHFPDAVSLNPPPRSTKCRVLVLANGHVGKIDILQSCGDPSLDQKWISSLMKAKFRPAYRDGIPYDASKDVELKCGNQ